MARSDTDTGTASDARKNAGAEDPAGHDFGADYESEYTVPALVKQNERIESGLMSPHDIPESMPVLRAFHEFLDQERRRTQRRMMILSGVCIGLVAVVIVCGVLLVANYGSNARYQYALMERDLAYVREDATGAKTSLTKYADKTDKLKDMIVNSQQQLATIQTRAATTADQQQRDIEALRRQIELLQASRPAVTSVAPESDASRKRHDDLIRDLEKTRAELMLAKAAAERPLPTVQDTQPDVPRPEPVRVALPPSRPPAFSPPHPSTVSTNTTSIQIPLTPRGAEQPVTWRLPVPSR